MNKQKILNLLGMAQRANRIVSGDFTVTKAVQGKKAELIIVAVDSSEETRKRYQSMAEFYGVNIRCMFTKEELGHCLGKEFRAVAALQDKGFANAILKQAADD